MPSQLPEEEDVVRLYARNSEGMEAAVRMVCDVTGLDEAGNRVQRVAVGDVSKGVVEELQPFGAVVKVRACTCACRRLLSRWPSALTVPSFTYMSA
jgi:polyribonucleotide nucleotidyltransferase